MCVKQIVIILQSVITTFVSHLRVNSSILSVFLNIFFLFTIIEIYNTYRSDAVCVR